MARYIDIPQELRPWSPDEVPRLEKILVVPDPYNWGDNPTLAARMKEFDDSPSWARERERRRMNRGDPI